MKEKRIFIHCGPGKTGSSAIQKWLNENRSFLTQNGIDYPPHNTDKNGVSSGNADKIFNHSKGASTLDSVKCEKTFKDFYASDKTILLLSSEVFFLNIEEIYKYDNKVTFILFIRDQKDLIESNYNQSVKRHGQTREMNIPNNLPCFQINRIINLARKLPEGTLRLLPYSTKLFEKKSAVEYLMSAIGVNIETKLQSPPEWINNSYTLEALEYKRMANLFIDQKTDKRLDIVLQGLKSGTKNYTFFPAQLLETYRQTVLQHITTLNKLIRITDFDDLVKTIQLEDTEKTYINQKTYKPNFEKIKLYIAENDKSLAKNIAKDLKRFYEQKKLLLIPRRAWWHI